MDVDGAKVDSSNLAYVETMYGRFVQDAASVPRSWRDFFEQHEAGPAGTLHRGPRFKPSSVFSAEPPAAVAAGDTQELSLLQDRVDQFVRSYRIRGHLVAKIDPLDQPRHAVPELDPAYYGLTETMLDQRFSSATIAGPESLTLREIIERLRNTYCRSIGVQFMHIGDHRAKHWLQNRMEETENRAQLSTEQQYAILTKLTDAVILEEFIQKKYLGAKSFSLEGGESLVPLLQLALNKAALQGMNGLVIGMPHRGRLNVLVNIIGKNPREIFQDFEGTNPEYLEHMGDVKYHQGHGATWTGPDGHEMHVSLCFNPSHLEFVNPVALGRARANVDRYSDPQNPKGMAILVHGDAAFAGEGVVQEVLNMSRLKGYATGGTVHVIINNQIGFTTDPADSRSTLYAADVAKMLQVPIFQVNGEDPEAVAQVVELAMDYRNQFKRDAVIDMYCYRKRGHNEGDEPAFTQPLMYKAIKQKKSVRRSYRDRLVELGSISAEEADAIATRRREELEAEFFAARSEQPIRPDGNLGELWSAYRGGPQEDVVSVPTGVPAKRLKAMLKKMTQLPEGFAPHPKIARWLDGRRAMAAGEQPLDWAAAEALAFASLAVSSMRVRLSGQDSQRGTFSHRHSVLHDVNTGKTYSPLQHVAADQASVEIYNSPLNETGVLGFEYGYSLDTPDGLVLWEAQFGDFSNAAQVIIDQFIVSAEDKWGYLSGIVLLLPHGFEGMGPEHSSARLERFLQLAADDNIQIVAPTTPAQYFHCLRRQVISMWRKPLIVMSPKSLLRHESVVSGLDQLAAGRFRRVLPDQLELDPEKVKRILLCSGKIFYELDSYRKERERNDVAIIRLEQLYPVSHVMLQNRLERYRPATPVVWVQEEPENMGAWRYLHRLFCPNILGTHPFSHVSRPEAASPATGSSKAHQREQLGLIEQAFAI